MTDRRRTFVPVAGAGLSAAALAAVAASRPWAGVDPTRTAVPFVEDLERAGEMPLGSALSLVVLAAWGVVLVTRRRVRRTVAGLALAGSLGYAATVVVGAVTLPDQVAEAVREGGTSETPAAALTGWFWVAALAAAVLVVTTALATAWCAAWPEMGSRYDAPGAGSTPRGRPAADPTNLDLWKSLDEGRDPTA